jgi:hypothetical protein
MKISDLLKDEPPNVRKAIIAQEKWRQKQIYIYYISGRPLFSKHNLKLKTDFFTFR